jgi:hypothetical protein
VAKNVARIVETLLEAVLLSVFAREGEEIDV